MKCFHPSFYLQESEPLVRKVPGCKTLREITVWNLNGFCPACFHPDCSWTWECKAYVLFRKLPCEGREGQLERWQLSDCLTTTRDFMWESLWLFSHCIFFNTLILFRYMLTRFFFNYKYWAILSDWWAEQARQKRLITRITNSCAVLGNRSLCTGSTICLWFMTMFKWWHWWQALKVTVKKQIKTYQSGKNGGLLDTIKYTIKGKPVSDNPTKNTVWFSLGLNKGPIW